MRGLRGLFVCCFLLLLANERVRGSGLACLEQLCVQCLVTMLGGSHLLFRRRTQRLQLPGRMHLRSYCSCSARQPAAVAVIAVGIVAVALAAFAAATISDLPPSPPTTWSPPPLLLLPLLKYCRRRLHCSIGAAMRSTIRRDRARPAT